MQFLIRTLGWERGFNKISLCCPSSRYHFDVSQAVRKVNNLLGDEPKTTFCEICGHLVGLEWNSRWCFFLFFTLTQPVKESVSFFPAPQTHGSHGSQNSCTIVPCLKDWDWPENSAFIYRIVSVGKHIPTFRQPTWELTLGTVCSPEKKAHFLGADELSRAH